MENRNTVIALILMLVVWFGYSLLFPPQPPQNTVTTGGEERHASAPAEKTEDRGAAPRVATEVSTEVADIPAPIPGDVDERSITVETDLYTAVFTSRGARLVNFRLKNYHEGENPESPLVAIIDADAEAGSLRLTGSDGFGVPADLLYGVSVEEDTIRLAGDDRREVRFIGTTAGGLRVEKTFIFRAGAYDFDLAVRLVNTTSTEKRGDLALTLVQPWSESMEGTQFEFVGPVTLAGEEVNTDDIDDIAETPVTYGDPLWTAFENKYFISAAVPLEDAGERVQIEKSDDLVLNRLTTPQRTLAPGEAAGFDYLLYYGPRDLEILKGVNYRLEEAIDFGFFSLLALPLRHVLTFFYGFVGNYGVAIILLTVVIKLLFWPLTHKSYASMKAMQKLQPEMQKIREKFKNDRERMNRELMEMYKTHRVNPLGGCLPMLVQIPVFFALYKVLLGDIALRHAPFMLWITDLSAKDPYYITPIVMGGTMFLQQKMTPTTMDPTQAKMFMIMPVVFTFLFLNFPAGLVIYWLTNNVLTIAQQALINRKA